MHQLKPADIKMIGAIGGSDAVRTWEPGFWWASLVGWEWALMCCNFGVYTVDIWEPNKESIVNTFLHSLGKENYFWTGQNWPRRWRFWKLRETLIHTKDIIFIPNISTCLPDQIYPLACLSGTYPLTVCFENSPNLQACFFMASAGKEATDIGDFILFQIPRNRNVLPT